MDIFSFSKAPRIFLTALILIIIEMSLFYTVVFQDFYQIYMSGFWDAPVRFKTEDLGKKDLVISATIPKYYAEFQDYEVIVRVENQGNDIEFIEFMLVFQEKECGMDSIDASAPDTPLHYYYYYIHGGGNNFNDGESASNVIFSTELQPYGVLIKKVLIAHRANTTFFDINGESREQSRLVGYIKTKEDDKANCLGTNVTPIEPVLNRFKAFLNKLIEFTLFPPWSNAFLPFLVIVSVWCWAHHKRFSTSSSASNIWLFIFSAITVVFIVSFSLIMLGWLVQEDLEKINLSLYWWACIVCTVLIYFLFWIIRKLQSNEVLGRFIPQLPVEQESEVVLRRVDRVSIFNTDTTVNANKEISINATDTVIVKQSLGNEAQLTKDAKTEDTEIDSNEQNDEL